MAGPVDLQEFVIGFVVEAEEYLGSINQNLVAVSEALKKDRAEPRAVRELFRSLHTIKGLAAMISAEPIVAISHEMESILRVAERRGGGISDATLNLLLQGTRAIEERVQATSEKGVIGIPPAPKALLEALAATQSSLGTPSAHPSTISVLPEEIAKSLNATDREQVTQAMSGDKRLLLIEFRPSAENAAKGFNISAIRDRFGKLGEIIKVVPQSSAAAPTGIIFSLLLETQAGNAALTEASGIGDEFILHLNAGASAIPSALNENFEQDGADEWTPTDQSSVRVDIRRLDETLERLGELVVTRSKLARVSLELQKKGVDTRDLNSVLAENTRQLKRLRGAVTKARMVPLAELFQRLPLVVRGLSRNSEKSVDLSIQVGLAEIDKAVADKIFPAIVHLIRNSFDHAVETKAERRRLGKPETAVISVVSDDSSGTNMVLSIADDGRGIDREAVAKKARMAVAKNDDELLAQIAMPGLSTSPAISTTSGRGMGMDIVKRSIEKLGGRLSLKTTLGQGTIFSMQVPVSVTIVDVLSFICGEQTFAVPLAMVDEIIEVEAGQIVNTPLPETAGAISQLIQRRGLAIPFLALETHLYKKSAALSPKALIVNQLRGGAIAFGIDRMIGQQEVVVRPVNDALVRVKGMAGATDLGDGRPTLVLDLATIGSALSQVDVGTL